MATALAARIDPFTVSAKLLAKHGYSRVVVPAAGTISFAFEDNEGRRVNEGIVADALNPKPSATVVPIRDCAITPSQELAASPSVEELMSSYQEEQELARRREVVIQAKYQSERRLMTLFSGKMLPEDYRKVSQEAILNKIKKQNLPQVINTWADAIQDLAVIAADTAIDLEKFAEMNTIAQDLRAANQAHYGLGARQERCTQQLRSIASDQKLPITVLEKKLKTFRAKFAHAENQAAKLLQAILGHLIEQVSQAPSLIRALKTDISGLRDFCKKWPGFVRNLQNLIKEGHGVIPHEGIKTSFKGFKQHWDNFIKHIYQIIYVDCQLFDRSSDALSEVLNRVNHLFRSKFSHCINYIDPREQTQGPSALKMDFPEKSAPVFAQIFEPLESYLEQNQQIEIKDLLVRVRQFLKGEMRAKRAKPSRVSAR